MPASRATGDVGAVPARGRAASAYGRRPASRRRDGGSVACGLGPRSGSRAARRSHLLRTRPPRERPRRRRRDHDARRARARRAAASPGRRSTARGTGDWTGSGSATAWDQPAERVEPSTGSDPLEPTCRTRRGERRGTGSSDVSRGRARRGAARGGRCRRAAAPAPPAAGARLRREASLRRRRAAARTAVLPASAVAPEVDRGTGRRRATESKRMRGSWRTHLWF